MRNRTWSAETARAAIEVFKSLGGTAQARKAVAEAVGRSERTIWRWWKRFRDGEPLLCPPGRRELRVARKERQKVIRLLFERGPRTGVPVLRALCPRVPYRQIAKLKRRFLAVLRHRWGWYRRRLIWLRAGATWAMDFTAPSATLPGRSRRLLHVRDLASGAELLVLPCPGERASVVGTALAVLLGALGIPLLIKMDNGKAFTAGSTRALLQAHGVTALYSPTYTPQYNGACERAGGGLQERTAYEALRQGHPGVWTEADLHVAWMQANTEARPWGATGPTPAEVFRVRVPIRPAKRAAFQRTRAAEIETMVETHKETSGRMPTCREQAAIDRLATQRALCEHGYLEFGRGRISTPIQTWRRVTRA